MRDMYQLFKLHYTPPRAECKCGRSSIETSPDAGLVYKKDEADAIGGVLLGMLQYAPLLSFRPHEAI